MKKSIIAALILTLFLPTNSALAGEGDAIPQGSPTAVPAVRLPNPVYANGATSTSLLVEWDAPTNNGGSPLLSYSAVAYKGAGFTTVEVGASCPATHVSGTSVYSCTITGMNFATTYVIKVTATNQANYTSNPTSSAQFTTPSIPQTVSITGDTTPITFGSGTRDLDATSDSGLTISWTTNSPSICSVDSTGLVTFLAAGTCSITASQDGSGSSYAPDDETITITVNPNISASASTATSVTGTTATLRGTVPFSGENTAVVFCIATTNSNANCTAPAGVTVGTSTPSTITSSSSTSVSASVSGLTSGTTYYYWIQATASGTTVKSSTSSFTTSVAPTLTLTGPTSGQQNQPFTTTLTASSGSGVYSTWGANTLPTGLALSPSGAEATISGTPTVAGTTNSIITVTDSAGLSSSVTVTFTITAPPPPPAEEDTTANNDPLPEQPETPEQRAAREAAEEAARIAAEEAAKKKAAEDAKLAEEKAAQEAAAKKAAEDAAKKAESEKPGNVNGIKEIAEPINDPITGTIPNLNTGNILTLLDSKPITLSLQVLQGKTLELSNSSLAMEITTASPDKTSRPIIGDSTLTAYRKDLIRLKGSGFIANTKISVWLFSTPTLLGKIDVTSDGTYDASLLIPEGIEVGRHTLQINGITKNNQIISIGIGMEILASPVIDDGTKKPDSSSSNGESGNSGESKPQDPGTSSSSSDSTVVVKDIVRQVLFRKGSAVVESVEKSKIKGLRKYLAPKTSLRCIGYTYSKKPTSKEKALAKSRATAACKYLISTKKFPFKVSVAAIKGAPKATRSSKVRTQRVDIRFTPSK